MQLPFVVRASFVLQLFWMLGNVIYRITNRYKKWQSNTFLQSITVLQPIKFNLFVQFTLWYTNIWLISAEKKTKKKHCIMRFLLTHLQTNKQQKKNNKIEYPIGNRKCMHWSRFLLHPLHINLSIYPTIIWRQSFWFGPLYHRPNICLTKCLSIQTVYLSTHSTYLANSSVY